MFREIKKMYPKSADYMTIFVNNVSLTESSADI